jgi:hypothetical protein
MFRACLSLLKGIGIILCVPAGLTLIACLAVWGEGPRTFYDGEFDGKPWRIAVNYQKRTISSMGGTGAYGYKLHLKGSELKRQVIFGTARGGYAQDREPSASDCKLWDDFFGIKSI